MANRPLSVSMASIFILLNALVWLTFGIIIAADAHPALPDAPLIKWTMAFLALAIAGILLGLFILLGKCSRIAYFLASGLLFATSLVAVLDDVGLADLVFLVINIVPIILLIKDRAWYLGGKASLRR